MDVDACVCECGGVRRGAVSLSHAEGVSYPHGGLFFVLACSLVRGVAERLTIRICHEPYRMRMLVFDERRVLRVRRAKIDDDEVLRYPK